MLFYYGKTFEAARPGVRLVPVECGNCGGNYFYELARIGTAASTASYGIGTGRAERKAAEKSVGDLQQRLELEAELVPCPHCNWINDELVTGYRQWRYRRLGVVALGFGFAGASLSLVLAWFFSNGSPTDRWLAPYFLIGGPAAFAGFAVGLLLLRSYLRRRIQPNRDFPSPPTLPFGSPPALVMDKSAGRLSLATKMQPPEGENEGLLDIQFGRHELPPICGQCLGPSAKGGHPIQVTKLVHFEIPLCDNCCSNYQTRFQGISSRVIALGLLVEIGLAATMWLKSIEWWIIVVFGLVAFGVILVAAALLASVQTAPAKVVRRDRSRGVVRLRFRNEAYVYRVVQLANAEGAT